MHLHFWYCAAEIPYCGLSARTDWFGSEFSILFTHAQGLIALMLPRLPRLSIWILRCSSLWPLINCSQIQSIDIMLTGEFRSPYKRAVGGVVGATWCKPSHTSIPILATPSSIFRPNHEDTLHVGGHTLIYFQRHKSMQHNDSQLHSSIILLNCFENNYKYKRKICMLCKSLVYSILYNRLCIRNWRSIVYLLTTYAPRVYTYNSVRNCCGSKSISKMGILF